MRNSLLKTAKFHKLFGETDVWHQGRFPLGRSGMPKATRCLAGPLRANFFWGTPAIILVGGIIGRILSDLYLPKGRTFMTDQENEEGKQLDQSTTSVTQAFANEKSGQPKEQTGPVRKTLYEVLATLGHRLLQLFLVFIFYMLGNLLSVGIFVVFFFCSMMVYWLTKRFEIPIHIGQACRGLEYILLCFGFVSAFILLCWNTYNFIMDLVKMLKK